uniref:PH domain-containing protein n=1 Tax=Branchiostoma floridae TaxID=7739 RepID=C3Y058_BRAFL|eukprot:XP_002610414.1 hypothetical protein BRAFLDRAFT_72362 [Branchiostoma floridae]
MIQIFLRYLSDEEEKEGAAANKTGNESTSSPGIGDNPFLDVPRDPNAVTFKQGFLLRKCTVEADGRKTPLGKRGWKMFYASLKGLILFMHKEEYRYERQVYTEDIRNSISIHHSLASKATDYKKRPNVFRLRTAEWRIFLFQASDQEEMQDWMTMINLAAASLSSPPLPAAIGSQKKFRRPVMPVAPTRLTPTEQLQHHENKVQSLEQELAEHRQYAPDKRARSHVIREWHEKHNYLEFEITRFKTYVYLLQSKIAQDEETAMMRPISGTTSMPTGFNQTVSRFYTCLLCIHHFIDLSPSPLTPAHSWPCHSEVPPTNRLFLVQHKAFWEGWEGEARREGLKKSHSTVSTRQRPPKVHRSMSDRYSYRQAIMNSPRVVLLHAAEDGEFVRRLVEELIYLGWGDQSQTDISCQQVTGTPGDVSRAQLTSTLTLGSVKLVVPVISRHLLADQSSLTIGLETAVRNNKSRYVIWLDQNKDDFREFGTLVSRQYPTLEAPARRVQRDRVEETMPDSGVSGMLGITWDVRDALCRQTGELRFPCWRALHYTRAFLADNMNLPAVLTRLEQENQLSPADIRDIQEKPTPVSRGEWLVRMLRDRGRQEPYDWLVRVLREEGQDFLVEEMEEKELDMERYHGIGEQQAAQPGQQTAQREHFTHQSQGSQN